MRWTIVIDQKRSVEWGLNVNQAALFGFLYALPARSDDFEVIDGELFYRASRKFILESLPILDTKTEQGVKKYLQVLEQAGLIKRQIIGNSRLYVALTEKGKRWNSDGGQKSTNMTYTIVIDQLMAIEWGLNLNQAFLLDFLFDLASWVDKFEVVEGKIYRWITKRHIVNQLPLSAAKTGETIKKYMQHLEKCGLINRKVFHKTKLYVNLTDKAKRWNVSHKEEGGVQKYLGRGYTDTTNKLSKNKLNNNNIGSQAAPAPKLIDFNKNDFKPNFIDQKLWDAFLKQRAKKKAPNDQFALELFRKTLDEAESLQKGLASKLMQESYQAGYPVIYLDKYRAQQSGASNVHPFDKGRPKLTDDYITKHAIEGETWQQARVRLSAKLEREQAEAAGF